MVKLLKLLLTYKFRSAKPAQKIGGFTLIELLVGLILAFLIITPLLGFVVNMLQTDRQEQAKATSEQEIQAALDYIARDMEQAIYIYDGYGLGQIQSKLPQPANSTPVLVFWKRQFISKVLPTDNGQDDGFVYSLVAYYIRKNPNCTQTPFSCTAQITRTQFKDAVKVKDSSSQGGERTIRDPEPSGFQKFDTQQNWTSVEAMMNGWNPGANLQSIDPEVLIDYIDQTPLPATSTTWCQPVQRTKLPPGVVDLNAYNQSYNNSKYQQVPIAASGANTLSGFLACVDLEKNSATVFLRGNALARIKTRTQPPQYVSGSNYVSSYFPSARIEVKGNGAFDLNRRS